MNQEKISSLLYKIACMAALPDSQKQRIWEEAAMKNPDRALLDYFDRIFDGADIPQGPLGKAIYDL